MFLGPLPSSPERQLPLQSWSPDEAGTQSNFDNAASEWDPRAVVVFLSSHCNVSGGRSSVNAAVFLCTWRLFSDDHPPHQGCRIESSLYVSMFLNSRELNTSCFTAATSSSHYSTVLTMIRSPNLYMVLPFGLDTAYLRATMSWTPKKLPINHLIKLFRSRHITK